MGYEPMLSICARTNLRPVSATVTTSTMHALPMTTPNAVKQARSLFARRASIETDSVSRRSIIPFHSGNRKTIPYGSIFQFVETRLLEGSCTVSGSPDFRQMLQRFLCGLVLGIKLDGGLVFRHGSGGLALLFEKAAQPVVHCGKSREVGAHPCMLEVPAQQVLGLLRLFSTQYARKRAIKIAAGIGGIELFHYPRTGPREIRLAARHPIKPDVKNQNP